MTKKLILHAALTGAIFMTFIVAEGDNGHKVRVFLGANLTAIVIQWVIRETLSNYSEQNR